jgi:hypothetical protein
MESEKGWWPPTTDPVEYVLRILDVELKDAYPYTVRWKLAEYAVKHLGSGKEAVDWLREVGHLPPNPPVKAKRTRSGFRGPAGSVKHIDPTTLSYEELGRYLEPPRLQYKKK